MTAPTHDAGTLISLFDQVRSHTEQLAAPLSPEDQTVQSMPDVSPTKWHRAHVTWFFETFLLAEAESTFRPFQDQYWFLFNSYYEALGPRYARAERGYITRPGAHDVGLYRSNVDARIRDLVSSIDGGTLEKLSPTIELGFHHEQQHQELLLMDIKHVLSVNTLHPVYGGKPSAPSESDRLGWVDVEGGLVEVGHQGPGFSFDNEMPRHRTWLEPFRLADRLVTNEEWMHFMADDGYSRPELWLSDGWARVTAEGWSAPFYWSADGDGTWHEHTLHGTHPVNPGLPATHLSHYEADAYATWARKRLPTEAEWEHAVVSDGQTRAAGNLADTETFHARAAGPATGHLRQVFGDCWEWTASSYLP
ncbi:MAG: ergothioneine biosynthesis protein EgtB, partial [Aeromicrobium sp.]